MTPLRLGSRYRLDERMGEGGLGVVWRGSDIETGAGFAIKLLRPEYARDQAAVARFIRERAALLRFRHPNVVALHDMIVEGDRLALVMELVADGDLAAHRKRCGGTLDPSEATEIMAQVCNALATAHAAGIVHRDLKPANILLDGGTVRLTDFGIAQIAGEPSLTSEGVFLGTLPYLAPEVIQGDEPTPACDCYAVGVTLYELLAGDLPFTGQAAAVMHGHLYLAPERPDGIPDSSWRLIAACLDKDPRRRPCAAELELALRTDPWVVFDRDGVSWTTGPVGTLGEDTEDRAAVPETDPVTISSRSLRRRRPHGRGPRRGFAIGALAILAAASVIALALARSLGPSHPFAGPAVTVTKRVTPAGRTATLGTVPGAVPGQPSPQSGHTGTAQPSPGSTGVIPSATRSSSPTTGPPSATPTATHSASPTATPTPTGPVDTAWRCGAVTAATMASSGSDTGQTLQACIRVHDGKLDLRGTLNGTIPGWREQIVLVLEDSQQNSHGSYTSPVCKTADCTFSTSVVPARGEWTVLPEWVRKGSTQSSGDAPGDVKF
jgi:serine/threonine protein kinase, bacterial